MILTESQVKQIIPLNSDYKEWTILLNKHLPLYDVNTKERIVMFLAQTVHESGQYRLLKENLNYSREGLLKVFPKYFNSTNVDAYARNPEKIANKVYANRMGNRGEASGDGWKYRGRGVIGTTFMDNYNSLSLCIHKTLDDTVKYLETKEGALIAGLFYWHQNQLNSFADAKDVIGATKRINGGINGLGDRELEYKRISTIL